MKLTATPRISWKHDLSIEQPAHDPVCLVAVALRHQFAAQRRRLFNLDVHDNCVGQAACVHRLPRWDGKTPHARRDEIHGAAAEAGHDLQTAALQKAERQPAERRVDGAARVDFRETTLRQAAHDHVVVHVQHAAALQGGPDARRVQRPYQTVLRAMLRRQALCALNRPNCRKHIRDRTLRRRLNRLATDQEQKA